MIKIRFGCPPVILNIWLKNNNIKGKLVCTFSDPFDSDYDEYGLKFDTEMDEVLFRMLDGVKFWC